jgi:phage gp16-like protein
MPVKIRKVKGGIRVSTPGGVKAKHTTMRKAKRQRRLLNAIDHGWKPSGKKGRRK